MIFLQSNKNDKTNISLNKLQKKPDSFEMIVYQVDFHYFYLLKIKK